MEVGFLQETKSILKSLVLSCPNGMTLERLNRDYKEVVGSWIPHQKLGYSSLELFLKSIPDTLVVTGCGREARIGFVSNEKLQHINEMVSQQKNTTRERKAAVSHGPSRKRREENVRQNHKNDVTNLVKTQKSSTNPSCALNPWTQPNSLYVCPSTSYTYQTVPPQQAYVYGNFLLGVPSAYSRVPYANNQTYKNTHVRGVIYNAQNNVLGKQGTTKTVLSEQSSKTSNEPNTKLKATVSKQDISKSDCSESMLDKTESKNILCAVDQQINTSESRDVYPSKDKRIESLTDAQETSESMQGKQKDCNTATGGFKYPSKEKVTGRRSSLSDVADQKDSSKGVLVQEKKSVTISGNVKVMENQKSSEATLTEGNKTKSASDLHRVSKSVPNEIKYPGKRMKAVIKAFETHINIESEKEKEKDNKNVIKDPFSQFDSSDNDIDEAVPEFAANNMVFRIDFPENTVSFGKKIPSCALPKEFKKDHVVGVFISEIHSPFKFWFHIYKENHELDILMNRIECFYRRLCDGDLVIPKSCLTSGQVCAALFNNMWHRAEILTNVTNNKVKVHFVDYGTVSEVEIQHVKYLPIAFANTPMQAIRGSLSHIKPVSPLWPKSAIREFLSMVSEVLLYARIVEIDEKDKTVYMVLCDSNSGEAVQINTQLVNRGFAKLDKEWDENKIAKNGYRNRHPREIFPTFEMLETGEYPSLFELEQLLAQGIDYEKLTEKMILSNLNNNECDELVLREDCLTRKNARSFNLLDTNPFKSDIISEIVSLKIFND